jgi:adenylate cyclase
LLLLVGIIVVVQYLSLRPPAPSAYIPPEQSQPPPFSDKPSIAVLPFTNMSGDPGQEYFSDGITDTLITDLSKIAGLFVIAQHSVFTYKGKGVKVGQISQELGVRYVLEGSVQKADDRVRVNVQLVDATTGGHLWAERYDRPLKNLFALQDELVREIVTALRVEMWEAELKRVQRMPSENLTAYELVLRGQEALNRVFLEINQAANAQARQFFEKALALDPTYAAACASLGWTYFNDWFNFWNLTPRNAGASGYAGTAGGRSGYLLAVVALHFRKHRCVAKKTGASCC